MIHLTEGSGGLLRPWEAHETKTFVAIPVIHHPGGGNFSETRELLPESLTVDSLMYVLHEQIPALVIVHGDFFDDFFGDDVTQWVSEDIFIITT